MSSPQDFDTCMEVILPLEGGLANNPNDPGGLTNRGIALATYINYLKSISRFSSRTKAIAYLKNLSKEDAIQIYKHIGYWEQSGASLCPMPLALPTFDFAINSGASVSRKYLQRALNASLSTSYSIYPLKIDGILGPKTISAISICTNTPKSALATTKELIALRRVFYAQLIKNKPHLHVFKNGWENRLRHLEQYISAHF